jgi:hypothetical protein
MAWYSAACWLLLLLCGALLRSHWHNDVVRIKAVGARAREECRAQRRYQANRYVIADASRAV